MKKENARKIFLDDQAEGATVQAEGLLRNAAKFLEEKEGLGHYNDDDTPYNFLDTYFGQKYKFTETNEGLRQVTSCEHLDPYSPSIVYSHLLLPPFFACSVDSFELAKKAKEKLPDTCDSCVTSGHSIFSEFMTTVGVMIIHGNVCVPCLEKHIKSVDEAKAKSK